MSEEWQLLTDLERLRDLNSRRTVAWDRLERARALVEGTIATLTEAHDLELERVSARAEKIEQALRADLERARQDLRDYQKLQTNLRESRENVDDGVLVKVDGPRTLPVGFGSRAGEAYPRPWTLGEIEDLCTRFRMAGAEESTEVRFKHEHAEATVPLPDLMNYTPYYTREVESVDDGRTRVPTVLEPVIRAFPRLPAPLWVLMAAVMLVALGGMINEGLYH